MLDSDILLKSAARNTIQVQLIETMPEYQSGCLLAHSFFPMRSVADQNGEFCVAIEGVNVLKRDISDVFVSFLIANSKNEIRPRFDNALEIIPHVLVIIWKTVMRIIVTHIFIVEPFTVVLIQIRSVNGTKIQCFSYQERIFHMYRRDSMLLSIHLAKILDASAVFFIMALSRRGTLYAFHVLLFLRQTWLCLWSTRSNTPEN